MSSISFSRPACAMSRKSRCARAVRELNRVVKSGLLFGSVTSDMAPELIDRYDLLRGVEEARHLVGMVGAVLRQRI